MSSESNIEQPEERPQQFRLIHLMTLMSGLAFFSAMAAPLYRAMDTGRQFQFILELLLQLLIAGGTAFFFSYRRSQLLKKSGQPIGIGYPGNVPGKYGPIILSSVAILCLAAIQLAMAWFLTMSSDSSTRPMFLIQQVQLSFFAGAMMMQLVWGRSIGTTEFFENGVAAGSFELVPWERITLRPSQFDENRIVMVNQGVARPNYRVGAITTTLLVLEPTRSMLLSRYEKQTPSHEKSPG